MMAWAPKVLDVILLGICIEAALLSWWLHRQGAQRVVPVLLGFLAAGLLLILLPRLLIEGAPVAVLAGVLGLAGIAHAFCLVKAFQLFIDRS